MATTEGIDLQIDWPLGQYDSGNGTFLTIKKEGTPPTLTVGGELRGELKAPILKTQKNVMFLFAHPDDEQYTAGLIQQLLANGQNVYVVYSTSGQFGNDVTGTYPSGSIALRDAREAEAVNSLTNLGVTLSNIYALRQDTNGNEVVPIYTELDNRLTTDGVLIDAIITFDDVGVYDNSEHATCQLVALEYMRRKASVEYIYYFTVPISDIDRSLTVNNDITDVGQGSNAVKDSFVDWYFELTAGQVTKKQQVITYHVTQYAEPDITYLQTHYNNKPYEYITLGAASINVQDDNSPLDYLKMLFRV